MMYIHTIGNTWDLKFLLNSIRTKIIFHETFLPKNLLDEKANYSTLI